MAGLLRAASLGDQLANQLRVRIVKGELSPGTHLVEDNLAEEHDVSRGPVRDALKMLSSEGLLENRRRGFYVRGFSRADVDELYSLRNAIESLACKLAIERADDASWSVAAAELAGMHRAAATDDWHEFAVRDLAFHTAFYEISGHERLQSLWDQYRPTFGALLDVTNAQDRDLRPTARDHTVLLETAQSGEVDVFLELLAGHLEGSKDRMCVALAPLWAEFAGAEAEAAV